MTKILTATKIVKLLYMMYWDRLTTVQQIYQITDNKLH